MLHVVVVGTSLNRMGLPELLVVGEMEHEVHLWSFTLLVRNVGYATVRVEIRQTQDVQQQCRAVGGLNNLKLFYPICCCFKHFRWTGLVERLCWWIGDQQWWTWEETCALLLLYRGLVQLFHVSIWGFIIVLFIKVQEETSFKKYLYFQASKLKLSVCKKDGLPLHVLVLKFCHLLLRGVSRLLC